MERGAVIGLRTAKVFSKFKIIPEEEDGSRAGGDEEEEKEEEEEARPFC